MSQAIPYTSVGFHVFQDDHDTTGRKDKIINQHQYNKQNHQFLLTDESAIKISLLYDLEPGVGHQIAVDISETLTQVSPHLFVGWMLLFRYL